MTSIHLVDPVRHATVAVGRYREAGGFATVMLDEIARCSVDYPLALARHPGTGELRTVAVLGFDPGQNCYGSGAGWNATSIPADIMRGPFVLGSEADGSTVLCIDEGDRSFNARNGDRLFDGDGRETPHLGEIRDVLERLSRMMAATFRFIAALEEHRLLCPLRLRLGLADGQSRLVEGLLTVNPLALAALEPERLDALNQQGYLGPAFFLTAALHQFERLRQLHNQSCGPRIALVEALFDA